MFTYKCIMTVHVVKDKCWCYCRRMAEFSKDESEELTLLDEEQASHMAELFQALGEVSRIKIISALTSGPKSVGVLATETGFSESSVSHHLRGLRLLRLVRAEKQGRRVFYRIADHHVLEIFQCGLDHVTHP